MLKAVRETWIDGYLKHSLDNLVRIELGLEEIPDAISRPWDVIVQQPNRAPRPLPPGQAMDTVLDELGQALLILGAPGAGKTTLLLELARDLLDRAERDVSHPMPVVFHLSSWAVRRRPLADWLVDELAERYYVQRKLAQTWIEADQVLPLLDGLDEVAPEHRAGCVEAINTFHHRHGLVPLAMCCRAADYQALSTRVELSGAVAIEPLLRAQVSTYLKQAGKPLDGVRTALREDETLWELLDTPLMLSIVTLAYRGRSAAEVRATGSLEERRAHLFANYSERMFERRTKATDYTREQTILWLAWLARSLMHANLSVFYVESMQPRWLPLKGQRRLVSMIPNIFSGLAAGLISGLLGGLRNGSFYGLAVGIAFGLIFGLGSWLNNDDRISPAEILGWSSAWINVKRILVISLVIALVNGFILGMVENLIFGLIAGLALGLVSGLFMLIEGGMFIGGMTYRTHPNEGIKRSLRNSITISLISGLTGGLSSGLGFWLFFGPDTALFGAIQFGMLAALYSGLSNGGIAYLKHYALRVLLWRNGYTPWDYIPFLDYAAERVFLRKIGGGYIFTHRLLMEYFATLEPIEQGGQTKAEQRQ